MKTKKLAARPAAREAVLALAQIKAATQSFDRGVVNALDALAAIAQAVEAATDDCPHREAPPAPAAAPLGFLNRRGATTRLPR